MNRPIDCGVTTDWVISATADARRKHARTRSIARGFATRSLCVRPYPANTAGRAGRGLPAQPKFDQPFFRDWLSKSDSKIDQSLGGTWWERANDCKE
ncbi:hypothetical protein [Haladaptatus sp. DFWS20]|uniref:hypothetical protein n=1 Tax=Haladaptatus sp. DFWS20 TaxID=3403467 RepID=UPI003EBA2083